jgi:hypothetical protein
MTEDEQGAVQVQEPAAEPETLSTNRAERRRQERAAKKAQAKPVPPAAKRRIAEVKNGRRPRPSNGGAGGTPPMSMDELPPDVAARLKAMGVEGVEQAETGSLPAILAGNGKRAKKYVALEQELALLLMLPAPIAEGAGDEFCAQHFSTQGMAFAARAVNYAESHEATYRFLVQFVSAGGLITLGTAGILYALPPLVHHGMPAPDWLRKTLGVPEHEGEQ